MRGAGRANLHLCWQHYVVCVHPPKIVCLCVYTLRRPIFGDDSTALRGPFVDLRSQLFPSLHAAAATT